MSPGGPQDTVWEEEVALGGLCRPPLGGQPDLFFQGWVGQSSTEGLCVPPTGGVPPAGPTAEPAQWLVPPPALSQSGGGFWVNVGAEGGGWAGTMLGTTFSLYYYSIYTG